MAGEPGGVYGLKVLLGRLKDESGLALAGPNEEGVPMPLDVPGFKPEGVNLEVVGKKVDRFALLNAGLLISELQASICSARFMRS